MKADERDAFQIWVNIKILEAMHEKLLSLNLIAKSGLRDPYFRVFGVASVGETKALLEEKIHLLQKLAFNSANQSEIIEQIGTEFLAKAQDTTFLTNIIREISDAFSIRKVIFLFDEAAHTFIPAQQMIFLKYSSCYMEERSPVKQRSIQQSPTTEEILKLAKTLLYFPYFASTPERPGAERAAITSVPSLISVYRKTAQLEKSYSREGLN